MRKNKNTIAITKIELLFVVTILSTFLSIVIPAIQKTIYICRIPSSKYMISTIDQSLAMYNSDLGAFPPDRRTNVKRKPQNANECSPTNRASTRGEFDNSVSEYYDDNLIRHLDGDTSNDMSIDGYNDVSVRSLDNYLDISISQENVVYNASKMPILTTKHHISLDDPLKDSTIKYNELDSERRTEKFQRDNPDPRQMIIRFDTYQIYCEDKNIDEKTPGDFMTNFTN
ncbi:hypothetical protein [Candidatus Uabimicrobium sp. HlEnr_7]|uniref:hypothetical protein n=1 Tax=Candidatus Uabimicrobium helgolandensis TaxID=3095367 RepID=UPI0035588B0E